MDGLNLKLVAFIHNWLDLWASWAPIANYAMLVVVLVVLVNLTRASNGGDHR